MLPSTSTHTATTYLLKTPVIDQWTPQLYWTESGQEQPFPCAAKQSPQDLPSYQSPIGEPQIFRRQTTTTDIPMTPAPTTFVIAHCPLTSSLVVQSHSPHFELNRW